MFNKKALLENPQEKANALSLATFWWLNSFMKIGSKKTLGVDDLYQLLHQDQSHKLGNLLEQKLTKEKNGKSNLFKALIYIFGPRVFFITALIFCGNCFFGIGPLLCLPMFIRSFDDDTIPIYVGYLYATVVVLGPGIYTVIYNLTFFALQREGMRVRIALCSIIYEKCMILNKRTFGSTSIGQVINMITNDVQQIESHVPNTVGFPLAGIFQMTVSVTILIYLVGPSCWIGISTMIFFLVLDGCINHIFNNLRIQHALRTDERIGVMNEIISGIRVIKMYAWETPFAKIINKYRRREVNILRRFTYLSSFFAAIFELSTGLTIFLTILTEILLGNQLSAEKVYLTVALFGNIKLIMDFFPSGIAGLYQIKVSIDRIQRFLSLPVDGHISDKNMTSKHYTSNSDEMNNTPLISCNKLTAKWPTKNENDARDTLIDLTFSVQNGQSIGIVGAVGSGKSSLLNALLGELTAKSGTCKVVGKLAYASQDPWILPGTVRDNIILCGDCELINEAHYSRVLKACSLDQDLSQFPKGDATKVGERGISLSGGQKARINLARALCVEADIYLLDDPLSAVDANVGRFIYKNAFRGLLKDKIVVLVTHQIHHLQDMERIIVLKEGEIEAIGNFATLSKDDRFSELFGIETTKNQYDQLNEMEVESVNASLIQTPVQVALPNITLNDKDRNKSFDNRFNLIWKFLREGGSFPVTLLSFFGFIVAQFGRNVTHYWLTIVTESASNTLNKSEMTNLHDWRYQFDTTTNMNIYAVLIVTSVIIVMVNLIFFYQICMKSSINIHNGMTRAILTAPMHFFDSNPMGRILNRFSKDIGTIDKELSEKIHSTFNIALNALGGMLLIGWINPWLLFPIPFILSIFYKIRKYYLMTAQDVKRLESTAYSSMLIHLSSTLNGLTTLRAHRCQPIFKNMFEHHQDVQTSAYYMTMVTAQWFALRLDFFCIIYTLLVSIICFALRGSINGSEAGLIICSVGEILGWFEYGISLANDMENDLISVERALEYSKDLPSENETIKPIPKYKSEKFLDDSLCPLEGAIRFQNVSLHYGDLTGSNGEASKTVLKDITFSIESKEKIGIVGRTGAGKSSLIVALFRLAEPTGTITIDGVDIKTLSLSELRSRISIVPQDPFLFTGSFRENLDPFNEYDDEELWRALETVELNVFVTNNSKAGLNSFISEGGANLSVGQRQLVCLARAILRENKILVLDEATANIDFETDALIQRTIKHHFKNCTVLTIAHRLNTVLDSNRVMVIDGGFLKEFDDPKVLLSQPESLFYNFVKQSGTFIQSQQSFKHVIQMKYNNSLHHKSTTSLREQLVANHTT